MHTPKKVSFDHCDAIDFNFCLMMMQHRNPIVALLVWENKAKPLNTILHNVICIQKM